MHPPIYSCEYRLRCRGCQPSLGPWLAGVCILSKAMTASPMTNADNPMYRKISDDMLSKIGIATITKLPWQQRKAGQRGSR